MFETKGDIEVRKTFFLGYSFCGQILHLIALIWDRILVLQGEASPDYYLFNELIKQQKNKIKIIKKH